MPRSGDPLPVGIADQEDVLEDALHDMRDEIIRLRHYVAQLEARVRAMEEQNAAAPLRQQEWSPQDFDLRAGFRFCRPLYGPDFRYHPYHAEEQFRCSVGRNIMGHSARSEARGRPSAAAATNWQEWGPEDVDVEDGFRVCRRRCGRDFRIHPNHPEESFCCSACRNNRGGHTVNCDARSRPSNAVASNVTM